MPEKNPTLNQGEQSVSPSPSPSLSLNLNIGSEHLYPTIVPVNLNIEINSPTRLSTYPFVIEHPDRRSSVIETPSFFDKSCGTIPFAESESQRLELSAPLATISSLEVRSSVNISKTVVKETLKKVGVSPKRFTSGTDKSKPESFSKGKEPPKQNENISVTDILFNESDMLKFKVLQEIKELSAIEKAACFLVVRKLCNSDISPEEKSSEIEKMLVHFSPASAEEIKKIAQNLVTTFFTSEGGPGTEPDPDAFDFKLAAFLVAFLTLTLQKTSDDLRHRDREELQRAILEGIGNIDKIPGLVMSNALMLKKATDFLESLEDSKEQINSLSTNQIMIELFKLSQSSHPQAPEARKIINQIESMQGLHDQLGKIDSHIENNFAITYLFQPAPSLPHKEEKGSPEPRTNIGLMQFPNKNSEASVLFSSSDEPFGHTESTLVLHEKSGITFPDLVKHLNENVLRMPDSPKKDLNSPPPSFWTAELRAPTSSIDLENPKSSLSLSTQIVVDATEITRSIAELAVDFVKTVEQSTSSAVDHLDGIDRDPANEPPVDFFNM